MIAIHFASMSWTTMISKVSSETAQRAVRLFIRASASDQITRMNREIRLDIDHLLDQLSMLFGMAAAVPVDNECDFVGAGGYGPESVDAARIACPDNAVRIHLAGIKVLNPDLVDKGIARVGDLAGNLLGAALH